MEIIAEMGCNHMGDMNLAREMVTAAAPYVWGCKFQKRDPLTFPAMDWPHPDRRNSFGDTYGEHRRKLEFSPSQHEQLLKHCHAERTLYGCSVWDVESAYEIMSIEPDWIKIPSPRNLDWAMCDVIRENWDGVIMVGMGMVDLEEMRQIEDYWLDLEVVYLVCTSSYPCTNLDVRLGDVRDYVSSMVPCGVSAHYQGTLPDQLAAALGAGYTERHFTLDKLNKGTDQRWSLDPKELMDLYFDLDKVNQMMAQRRYVLKCEAPYREKLR